MRKDCFQQSFSRECKPKSSYLYQPNYQMFHRMLQLYIPNKMKKDNDIDFSVFVQRQFYCKLAHFLTYNLKKNRLVNFISVLFIFIGVPSVISGPMISQSTFGPKIWRMNLYIILAVLVVSTNVLCQRIS